MIMRATGIAAALLFFSACATAQAPRAATPPPVAAVNVTLLPNEMGRVPVVMYHAIGGRGGYDKEGLNISPATFRRQLELMYRAGWYPVNFRDLFVPGGLQAVPTGKTPVVLTFDDGRGTQFRYRGDGSLDPDCAVGILEAFHRKHGSDWPRRATFFVLPRSKYTDAVFDQRGSEKKKLRFLVDAGYEVGNHSTTHPNMRNLGAERILAEVRTCRDYVRKIVPDATMDTFCLPYGESPRSSANVDLILRPEGSQNPAGRNLGICIAWGDESVSPYDRRFDRRSVKRFGVHPGRFEKAIHRLGPGGTDHRYVYLSDGDPSVVSVPRAFVPYVSTKHLDGARLLAYEPPASGGGKSGHAASRQAGKKGRRQATRRRPD